MNPSHANEAVQSTHLAEASSYWVRTRRLTLILLLVWALATFCGIYFARELSFSFFGWPFSFWFAAQGALLLYFALIAYYAYAMRKLDEAAAAGTERKN
jgi:putative solute:sodium symporter small subunit